MNYKLLINKLNIVSYKQFSYNNTMNLQSKVSLSEPGVAKAAKANTSSSSSSYSTSSSKRSYKDALIDVPLKTIYHLSSSSCSSSLSKESSPIILSPPDITNCQITFVSKPPTNVTPSPEKVSFYEKTKWLSKHYVSVKEMKHKNETTNKKRSPHKSKNTITVGSTVSRRIGALQPISDPKQKRRIRLEVRGTVVEELGKGRWTVSFENGVRGEFSSNQLKFVDEHEHKDTTVAEPTVNKNLAEDDLAAASTRFQCDRGTTAYNNTLHPVVL